MLFYSRTEEALVTGTTGIRFRRKLCGPSGAAAVVSAADVEWRRRGSFQQVAGCSAEAGGARQGLMSTNAKGRPTQVEIVKRCEGEAGTERGND